MNRRQRDERARCDRDRRANVFRTRDDAVQFGAAPGTIHLRKWGAPPDPPSHPQPAEEQASAGRGDTERVAVRRGLRDGADADIAARARLVLDDDRLPQRL